MGRRTLALVLTVLALALVPVADAIAATGDAKVFPLPSGRSVASMGIGPDGNVWFSENRLSGETATPIVALSPTGAVVSQQAVPSGAVGALGPDGNFWFPAGAKIGRMTPAGAVTLFGQPSNIASMTDVIAGPDGNVWFVERRNNDVYRITPAGQITKIADLQGDIGGMAFGADGNLWVTEFHPTSLLARITTAGAVTEFPLSRADAEPRGIAAGPDGNLWVAASHRNAIERVTTGGVATEFRLARANAGPSQIVAGVDGNLWFSESPASGVGFNDGLGRITTSGVVTDFLLPGDAGPSFGPLVGGDGNLWYSPGPSFKVVGRLTVAESGVSYVLSREAGFAPSAISTTPGKPVQWSFYGPGVHGVRDSTGLGLFDSGPRSVVSYFRTSFNAAGVYSYADTQHPGSAGKVTVAPVATPTSGGTSTAFKLTWAVAPPASHRVFDLQIQRPGSSAYVSWRTATTATSATFTPDAGPGRYSFRARLRDTVTGAKSGYAGRAITVK